MQFARLNAVANRRWLMAHVDSFAGVIFDYGGVLALHQTEDDAQNLASLAGIAGPLLGKLYWEARIVYDRGDVSGVEYWRAIGQRAGKPLANETIAQIIDYDCCSWMKFSREM
jgi:putative hydrolase of the HAD superfamily